LTKPFQSIRRLIEKVGELVSNKPLESEVNTAELPQREHEQEPKLSTAELEIVTADTMQMPDAMKKRAHEFVAKQGTPEPSLKQNKMETQASEVQAAAAAENNDGLLDLEDLEPAEAVADDDFELELDEEEPDITPEPVYSPAVEPSMPLAATLSGWERPSPESSQAQDYQPQAEMASAAVMAEDTRFEDSGRMAPAQVRSTTPISADNLSPEIIDAIARRAVEHLSEKVVQEIAWEVVPQLAELLIKRQLEESQPK